MNCAVCGVPFSFLARLGGGAADGVCDECQKQGLAEMRALVGAAWAPDDKEVFPKWRALAEKFHVPKDQANEVRAQLMDEVARRTAAKDHLTAQDLNKLQVHLAFFLNGKMPTPVMTDAVARIERRVVIDGWDHVGPSGYPGPDISCAGIMRIEDERCHWEEPARLLEQRSRREWIGGSTGVSVPLGSGVRYHVSGFKGSPIETAYLSDRGEGTLHVTSERICFAGVQQSASIPWGKIINLAMYSDGLAIHRIGAKKPTIVLVPYPELTAEIVALASPAKND